MSSTHSRSRGAVANAIGHYCTGISILLEGIEKLEHFTDHPFSVSFYFFAGTLVVTGTIFHHRLSKRYPKYPAFFYLLESPVLITTAWLFHAGGSQRLPYFYATAGLLTLAVAIFEFFTNESNRRLMQTRVLLTVSLIFFTIGAAVTGVNLAGHVNKGMNVCTLVLVIAGIILLFIRRRLLKQMAHQSGQAGAGPEIPGASGQGETIGETAGSSR